MEDLASTQSVLDAHEQVPVLTEEEKASVKRFCLASKEIDTENKALREARKALNAVQKSKKKWLQDWVREQGSKTFVLPRLAYKNADAEMGKDGLPPVPPYLRLTKNTTDATITTIVAEAAVMDVDPDHVRELSEKHKPLDALLEAIVDTARTSIRASRESVTITEKLEKGVRPIEVPEMPEPVARAMIDMHKASQKVKKLSSSHKEKTAKATEAVKKLQPTVASFLDKTGKASQVVKLEGGKAKIVKKTTARSTKVTLGAFEEFVRETLVDLKLPVDIEGMLASFAKGQKACARGLILKLNAIPKVSKSTVKFQFEGQDENSDSS